MAGQRLSRRDFLRMGALTTAGAALAACAPQVVEKTVTVLQTVEVPVEETVVVQPTAPPPEQQNVVIFVGFGTGTAAEQITAHEAMAEEFNAQSDLIKAEFLTVPYAENQAKFSTMLAADMPPDMCMPIGIGGVARNFDAWEDVTPYIDRDGYDLSVFFGPTVELHSYPGKGQLGLPVGVYPSVIFYNEDLFDAAGVDYPPHKIGDAYADGGDWTYTKMVEIGKKLTIDSNGNDADSPAFDWEKTTQWGWNGWDWEGIHHLAAKWGGTNIGVSKDYKTAEMNKEPWVTAVEFNKDTIWTWHVRATDEQGGAFYDVSGDPMGSGLVAMWECYSWMAFAYGAWTEAFNWDVAAVPAVEGFPVVAPIDADTFSMVKAAHHKDAAWEVIKWMFQPDILNRLCNTWGAIPAHQELAAAWVDDRKAAYPDVDFAAFLDAISYLDSPNHEAWVPDWNRVWDGVTNAENLIRTGENLNVQEVMDNLNVEVQGYLDEYWAKQ